MPPNDDGTTARRGRPATQPAALRVGDVVVDRGARAVHIGAERVELTRREFDLFVILAEHPERVFSRDELLRTVWQSDPEWQSTATITEHVKRLRSKLGAGRPFRISAVRGIGYQLEAVNHGLESADDPMSDLGSRHSSLIVDGTVVVAASQAALDLLGADDREQVVGLPLLTFIADRSRSTARQRIESRASDDLLPPTAMWFRRFDGRELLAHVSNAAITWEGRLHHQIDLWPAEDDGARVRRVATGIATEVSDAVIILDASFRVQTLNAAAEVLYGWDEHDVVGKPLDEVIPTTSTPRELGQIRKILRHDGHWHGDLEQVRHDGTAVPTHLSATVMGDDVGHDAGIVLVSRPVRGHVQESEVARELIADIASAIDAGAFHPHYQPIVNLETRRVVGVEALARWHHPTRGVLLPARFLPAAERAGDIVRLGRALLLESCRQVATWRRGGVDIDLAVNISAQQLLDDNLIADVDASLAAVDLAPAHLLVEITETDLIQDVNLAADRLHELSSRGVRIAIDDFGTGWASLTYLKRFPVDALKIDRTFTLGIDGQNSDVAIARSIISLGNELDLVVIAEGIETLEQETAMHELGCWLGQGHLYAEARPAEHAVIALPARGR